MHKFILRRLLLLIPVLLGVMFIIFTLVYITPGDPAQILLGERARPEDLAALREELGLNDPFLARFTNYVSNVLRFDLGTSYQTKRPVFVEIYDRFGTTMRLAAMSVLVTVLVGVPLGILCATRQYSFLDSICQVVGLIALSMPNFWLGLMLMLFFSLRLGWLPSTGFHTPLHWILPALTIGLSSAGTIMRFTRSSMLEVIRQDYMKTARAKGQKESVVILRHALKNALIPVVTVVGLQFGGLLGGAVLTETVFAIPGLGNYMVQSIRSRDFPIIQGGVLMMAIVFTFVNLLVDILYAYIDPRVKSQYK